MNAHPVNAVRSFARFWYGFVVGDDWRTALGVALGLAATAGLVQVGVNAWWLLPAAVAAVLGLSVHRAARGPDRGPGGAPKEK
ncbi:hypothetical protein ACEZCY_05735 [Streptacidiphilus sp. N1-12]|uniref:Uncharacterized protein n=2 Tax=Streptacidiphilus alkalitolerans TaxID=3342712 RepID=A0ABV6V4Y6_9ACTN